MESGAIDPAALIRALGDPDDAVVRETHGAWVLLAGERAYKVKKPVALAFLDYSTLPRRLRACREEVEVNAALAPGLYLGVRALVRTPGGVALGAAGEDPAAVEYAVEMRRFDEAQTMEAHVRAGTLAGSRVDEVAHRLAAFHRGAARCEGGAEPFARRLRSDVDEVAQLARGEEPPALDGRRRFAASAAERFASELDARAARGLCRDGHGDIRAEHVILSEPPMVFDRIEFDPGLRRADVGSDLAFLAMDLERLGARGAAERLVRSYAAAGGDPGGSRLRALFAWQRALVRLKVALIAGDAGGARALAALAERLAWRARAPVVLLVTGPPASGKSTLAAALAERLELPVVSSDVVRKSLAGLAPHERAPASAYRPSATIETYRELAARAAAELRRHPGVIVDATARSRELRAALLEGVGAAEPKALIVCEVPRAELARRALARQRSATRVSDATAEVALELADAFEPPDELDPAVVCRVRTDVEEAAVLERVARWLDDRLSPAS